MPYRLICGAQTEGEGTRTFECDTCSLYVLASPRKTTSDAFYMRCTSGAAGAKVNARLGVMLTESMGTLAMRPRNLTRQGRGLQRCRWGLLR